MTSDRALLVVGYRDERYALDAGAVREIVALPELVRAAEAPVYVRGLFNLRGQVIPVIDLGLRFGYGAKPPSLDNRVVVLDSGGYRIGLLVDRLLDFCAVDEAAVEPATDYQLPGHEIDFIGGVVQRDEGLVLLLDVEAVLHVWAAPDAQPWLPDAAGPNEPPEIAGAADGDADAAGVSTDRRILRRRARELAAPAAPTGSVDAKATHLLVRLAGERYGVPVAAVRECTRLRQPLAPVPRAPVHVVGHTSLRGEVLPVVDLRSVFDLPAEMVAEDLVVVAVGGVSFGIVAEALLDLACLAPTDPPAATPNDDADAVSGGGRPCVRAAIDASGPVGLVDADRLLALLLPESHPMAARVAPAGNAGARRLP